MSLKLKEVTRAIQEVVAIIQAKHPTTVNPQSCNELLYFLTLNGCFTFKNFFQIYCLARVTINLLQEQFTDTLRFISPNKNHYNYSKIQQLLYEQILTVQHSLMSTRRNYYQKMSAKAKLQLCHSKLEVQNWLIIALATASLQHKSNRSVAKIKQLIIKSAYKQTLFANLNYYHHLTAKPTKKTISYNILGDRYLMTKLASYFLATELNLPTNAAMRPSTAINLVSGKRPLDFTEKQQLYKDFNALTYFIQRKIQLHSLITEDNLLEQMTDNYNLNYPPNRYSWKHLSISNNGFKSNEEDEQRQKIITVLKNTPVDSPLVFVTTALNLAVQEKQIRNILLELNDHRSFDVIAPAIISVLRNQFSALELNNLVLEKLYENIYLDYPILLAQIIPNSLAMKPDNQQPSRTQYTGKFLALQAMAKLLAPENISLMHSIYQQIRS